LLNACTPPQNYVRNEGLIFGTSYHIIYSHDTDLKAEIKSKLNEFNTSLSTYDPQSIISKINQNIDVETDTYFNTVFRKAEEVTIATNGAFDITVAQLVNLWGFGFSKKDSVTTDLVDSLLAYVGMEKVKLENNSVKKQFPQTMLDASAIAKGYGVDVIADLLETHGITHYMVEIGGEMRVKGLNEKHTKWRVGIDKPVDDPEVQNRELEDIIEISDASIATSGNYRNYYYKDGKKYAHTINPHTGYPVSHQLLGVSVIAPNCMTADAYATAFMVLGLEESMKIVNQHPELEAYFICTSTDDKYTISYTKGFEKLIVKN